MREKIRIVHVITGLAAGGAEMMLYKLLASMDPQRFDSAVISLLDRGQMGQHLEEVDVPVHTLNMRRGLPNPFILYRLGRLLSGLNPDLIQSWMYHADMLGGLAAKLSVAVPVVWGVRHSNLDRGVNKPLTLMTARLCALLSAWLPARIVCCSQASLETHARLGYAREKLLHIPNGFDLATFHPDATARKEVRAQLQLPENALLVGLVGRFDPQKDHANFVQAAALLHRECPDVYFLLCGDGITWKNYQLRQWIEAAALADRVFLLGRRDDMPRLTVALDIASSSSLGEGFSNVIGEAMACGVPCVVTDVGDSASLVGDTGYVVPPRNPAALANAWQSMAAMTERERAALGRRARAHVRRHFSLAAIASRYERLYTDLYETSGRPRT